MATPTIVHFVHTADHKDSINLLIPQDNLYQTIKTSYQLIRTDSDQITIDYIKTIKKIRHHFICIHQTHKTDHHNYCIINLFRLLLKLNYKMKTQMINNLHISLNLDHLIKLMSYLNSLISLNDLSKPIMMIIRIESKLI